MAVPPHVRSFIDAVRGDRHDCGQSFADGSLAFDDILESASVSPTLGDMYVLKILEQHPIIGKVRARRLLEDAGVPQSISFVELNHDFKERLRGAVMSAVAAGKRP